MKMIDRWMEKGTKVQN